MELDNISREMSPETSLSPRRLSKKYSEKLCENEANIYGFVFHYLIIIINIAYYTCVIPFRVKKSHSGYYKICTNKIQKILTFLLNMITAIMLFLLLGRNLRNGEHIIEKPEAFIHLLSTIFAIPSYLTLFYVFWTKKSVLENALSMTKPNSKTTNRKVRILNVIVLLVIFITVCSNAITETFYKFFKQMPQPTSVEISNVHSKETMIFSANETANMPANTRTVDITFFVIMRLIFSVYSGYINELFVCLNFVAAIMTYNMANEFFNFLNSETDISQVANHYLSIRETTKIIQLLFGPFVSFYSLELLFACLHFPFTFEGGNTMPIILAHTYIIKFFITIYIAAEGSLKMKYFKEWLFQYKVKELNNDIPENDKFYNKDVFEILKSECGITKIGLGGRLFTVTYGFIGMFVSVLATYGAFQLQFYNATQARNSESAETTDNYPSIENNSTQIMAAF